MSRTFSFTLLLIAILLAPVFWRSAQANEYSTVPVDSPLYTHLRTVARAGWTGATPDANPHALPLTRYEIVLEAAKAIFAVQARHQAAAAWSHNMPIPALAALRELTAALQPDLQKLEIDAAATLAMLDEILANAESATDLSAPRHENPASSGVRPATTATSVSRPSASRPSVSPLIRLNPALSTPAAAGIAFSAPDFGELLMAEASISDRLRFHTALSTVSQQPDPLDSASWIAGHEAAVETNSAVNISGVTTDSAGASFSLTDWLRLRAQWSRRNQAEPPLLADLTMAGMPSQTALGGGVDIALAPSLTLSGEMARVEAGESTLHPTGQLLNGTFPSGGTRVGGGLGLSAWQNRLVLNANLARLIPEGENNAESTSAELNLGFNLTRNLRLRLLYQQLFSPQAQTRAERIIAGGLSVQF